MKIIKTAIATTLLGLATSANAAVLLEIDLSVADTITINATSGASYESITGKDITGFYLDSFFGTRATLSETLVTGNLTSAMNPSDGTPDLFSIDTGLNVWSYANGTVSQFEAGQTAFSGSATWTISSEAYAAALSGAMTGDIYFAADDMSDIPSAAKLGEWTVMAPVPEPSTYALMIGGLGLVGLMAARRKQA